MSLPGGSDEAQSRQIRSILQQASSGGDRPTDAQLGPVYKYLIPSEGSSKSRSREHWYCHRAKSELQRDAATFLIFLFAFKRDGTAKVWVDALEQILSSCEECCRHFGAARRRFGKRFMSHYPEKTRSNFFDAVDKWQTSFILSDLDRSQSTSYGSSSFSSTLVTLSPPILQLLLGEPSLLTNPTISALMSATTRLFPERSASLVSLGLTPVLLRSLSSLSEGTRQWAESRLSLAGRVPVSLEDWNTLGIQDEMSKLFTGEVDLGLEERWTVVSKILQSGALSKEAIRYGLLGSPTDDEGPAGRSILRFLSVPLADESTSFPVILEVFSALLHLAPDEHLWACDQSSDQPGVIFSEIIYNKAFRELLDKTFAPQNAPPSPPSEARNGKGKPPAMSSFDPLAWIYDFSHSLLALQTKGDPKSKSGRSQFTDIVPKIMTFCFQDLQGVKSSRELREAAAKTALTSLLSLQLANAKSDQISLNSIVEQHAKIIAEIAFRGEEYLGDIWIGAREAANALLQRCFHVDCKEILESVLGLAAIADNERRRLKLVCKAEENGRSGPLPVVVSNLHLASVKTQLWSTAYSTVMSNSPEDVASLMRSVSEFAHVEKLDRRETWNYEKIRLQEVVSEESYRQAKHAVNTALKITRDPFAEIIESVAVQCDARQLKSLWSLPNIPQAGIMLLLSPAEDIHDPMITLIQQSFSEVDDRGDCFRALLKRYPVSAMDGLIMFLDNFIQSAAIMPESCSLSKWLVRCFTDILDVLCGQSADDGPLLQTSSFLQAQFDGNGMGPRIEMLWDRMCSALSTIFKRTPQWAPLYDSLTMVDWMRDALIFGREITNNFRAFEAAALGQSRGSSSNEDITAPSPVKASRKGVKLIQRLEQVLRDLASWLWLTDVETLHQAFELIRSILSRMSSVKPKLDQRPVLNEALLDLEKWSRRRGRNVRLDDSKLSDLAEMLEPFPLVFPVEDDEFAEPDAAAVPQTSSPAPPPTRSSKPAANAFEAMMKQAGSKSGPPKPSTSSSKPTKKVEVVEILDISDEDFDDEFFEEVPVQQLDALERRAVAATKSRPSSIAPGSNSKAPERPMVRPATNSKLPHKGTNGVTHPTKPAQSIPRPGPPSAKLNMHVGPSSTAAPKKPRFKNQLLREAHIEHRAAVAERDRQIGGIVKKVPAASKLGSGLGAYTGARPKPVSKPRVESSSSSDTNTSSDEGGGGVGALVRKQKGSPVKLSKPLPERRVRPLQTISQNSDHHDARDRQRREQHAMRQRLKPDLTPLYRFILAWDPEYTGPNAPHPPQTQKDLAKPSTVPTTFPSGVDQYTSVMRSLFLQELWAQFRQEKASAPAIQTEICMRSYEDDYIDIELAVQGMIPQGYFVNETNLVILIRPGCRPVIAKVQEFKKRPKDVMFKVRILNMMDQKELCAKSKWQVQKHMSLSTALREFGALQGLRYYHQPLLMDVLQARSTIMPNLHKDDIREAQRTYDLNEPQAKAVLGALDVNGFALIQGPPGTGKTKTISGLVGKWMSERRVLISTTTGVKPPKAKILVCAPSNAAIDEVCKRLVDGVPGADGERLRPNVVRIGIDSSVNMAIKDVSLDSLVEARVTAATEVNGGGGSEYSRIQAELEAVKARIQQNQEESRNLRDEAKRAVEDDLHALMQKRTSLGHQSSKAKDAARDATRHLEGARRAARDAIISEADIVCSTLSGAGHDTLTPYTFETVIIDEAAQAIELSCLIPLRYGCKRCIMVGDPNQLPPTIINQEVEKFHYNKSLFVRMVKRSAANVQLLSIQYRMNPYISELPSKVFYNGQLKDGPDMATKTAAIWHERHVFGPYRFFNVDGAESRAGTSAVNTAEALAAVALYRGLEADYGAKINLAMRIGVITMYREQLWEMKRKFTEAFGSSILETIEFNTVDGFQGQEKDITILSCVRSGATLNSIGFLKDPRRMNVALTRAKSSLFIIGNGTTLEKHDERWKTIVMDAKERGFYVNYTSTTFAPVPEPKVAKDRTIKRSASDMSLDSESDKESASQRKAARRLAKAKSPKRSLSGQGSSMGPPPLVSPVKRKSSTDGLMSNSKGDTSKKSKTDPSGMNGHTPGNSRTPSEPKKLSVPNPPPPVTKAPPIPRPPPPKVFSQAPTMAKARPAEESMFIKKKKKPKSS